MIQFMLCSNPLQALLNVLARPLVKPEKIPKPVDLQDWSGNLGGNTPPKRAILFHPMTWALCCSMIFASSSVCCSSVLTQLAIEVEGRFTNEFPFTEKKNSWLIFSPRGTAKNESEALVLRPSTPTELDA